MLYQEKKGARDTRAAEVATLWKKLYVEARKYVKYKTKLINVLVNKPPKLCSG